MKDQIKTLNKQISIFSTQKSGENQKSRFIFFVQRFFCIFAIIFMIFSAFSCTTEITLTLKPDDSVDIKFEGGAGEAFTKMILSASGKTSENELSEQSGTEGTYSAIDKNAVTFELAKAGFENVIVDSQKNGVRISMTDRKRTSYIFTSGIIKLSENKDSLKTQITRKSLEDFYNSADEQTRMILDLFLSPVFNDEQMSDSEYLEMLASFYGEGAANEVQDSFVKINLVDKKGRKTEQRISLVQLLCGSF